MRYFSIIEQPTKEAVTVFAEKRNLTGQPPESYRHPQEDYLIASESPPIFVVSDGVTLNYRKLAEDKKRYPNPSPAGEVAKIFCESVLKNAQNRYDVFSAEKTEDVFKEANATVGEYNNSIGKSDISGNITGFYSATGAFAVIKDSKTYWVSICDSYVAHFDKEMNMKHMSSGVCTPYAVINGEVSMADHLEKGVFDIESGDRVFVFTDGFEHYMKNSEFLNLFKNWNDTLEERIAEFSTKMNLHDPEKYGDERSLIAIVI